MIFSADGTDHNVPGDEGGVHEREGDMIHGINICALCYCRKER